MLSSNMSNILRRLSVNLERGWNSEDSSQRSAASALVSNPSFNDFSMHIGQDVDHPSDTTNIPIDQDKNSKSRKSFQSSPTTFVVGSAPAPGGMPSPILTKALKIPHSPVGRTLSLTEATTPRSSLEVPGSTGITPKSLPETRLSEDIPGTPRSPTSPRSPKCRRSQKIDGLDYYEFCELIRSSSL